MSRALGSSTDKGLALGPLLPSPASGLLPSNAKSEQHKNQNKLNNKILREIIIKIFLSS
jgi:hypothetical protein